MCSQLEQAVTLLQSGELVAFPTETVYGLGADAANPDAVAKIFAAKKRPADHPLIVHLSGIDYLEEWACDIPDAAWKLAKAFWPGPLTLILKKQVNVPDAVTGGQNTVGVRVPAHPLALALLQAYAKAGGGKNGMSGVAAPSANRFGRISPTQAHHVVEELGETVPLVLDGGACEVGIESTIVDLSRGDGFQPRLLRPGHISPEEIYQVIGVYPEGFGNTVANQAVVQNNEPRVSGSLDAHYAPRTPLVEVDTGSLVSRVSEYLEEGKSCAVLYHSSLIFPLALRQHKQLSNDPHQYAQSIYAALREMDQYQSSVIFLEKTPQTESWLAVNDRLRRAICGAGQDE